jgi:hypothetical protein
VILGIEVGLDSDGSALRAASGCRPILDIVYDV